MKKSIIKAFKVLAGTICISSCVAGVVRAETSLKIGWTTADSKNDPHAIMAHAFIDEIDKIAPGEFKIQLFANGQLGNEYELLQSQQLGALDMSLVAGSSASEIAPSFQLNDLPFLYKSEEEVFRVLDGKTGKMIFDKLEKKGIIGLGFLNAGFRNVLDNTRPITRPEDLAGVKLRVVPSDIFIDIFKSLGANPVPMQWGDVYTAVQQGTIDGLEVPLSVAYGSKYQDIVKYMSLTQHIFNAPIFTISKASYSRLTKDQQAKLVEAANAALKVQRETVSKNNADILEKMKEAGVQINDIPDRSAFREKTKPVYDKFRDVIGADVVDSALSELGGQ